MRKVISVLVFMVMVFAFSTNVIAEEATGPAMDAANKTADYSGKVVTGTVNTVGEAVKGTGEVAVSPVAAIGNWFKGKDKAGKIVTDPVNKTGKTVKDAAVNTGKTAQGKK